MKNKLRPIEIASMVLTERGYDISAEDRTYAYAHGPDFNVRADTERNVIEFGLVKSFDRWANSTDHTVHVTKWWDDRVIEAAFEEAEQVLLGK
jgi:hypothetical protein